MKKEEIKVHTKKAIQETIRRDTINKRLDYAARNETQEVLTKLGTLIGGLTEEQVDNIRDEFGNNKITHEKKKPLVKRIVEAFINPFTAILLILALVSTAADIIYPVMQGTPQDADYLTVIIILVMVITSGALRFVQETRSGNAAAKLLDMITTTASVERAENGIEEIPLEEIVTGDIVHLRAGDMLLSL